MSKDHKPKLGAVESDMKDNKIMLLEEDLWCIHKYLDDLELPRTDKDGKEYSIVGRIKRLEERYLKQILETQEKLSKLQNANTCL